VQPALERAGLIVLHRAEDPDERLLRQILGVVLVARQPVGQSVHPVGVLTHQLVPGRHRGLVTGGIEYRGAAQLVERLYPNPVGVLLEVRHRHGGQLGCGRRILLVTAAITNRRLDIVGNTFVRVLIPITPASARFHARYRLRPG
jgi:hypothetical protein